MSAASIAINRLIYAVNILKLSLIGFLQFLGINNGAVEVESSIMGV